MPLQNSKLASTKARAATSMVISAQHPTELTWVSIGAIDAITRRADRTNARRRELDSDVPGQVVEIMPGPSTVTITLRRAVLYASTLVEVLGFDSVEDLINQNVPLNIRETRQSPSDNAGTTVVEYQGCFFSSNPFNYDITRDWIIMQDVDMDVAKIVVTKTPAQAV